MNIKPYDKTIKELLVSGRQFSIPRFQREYSWERKNYQEFLEDMINNLSIKNDKISSENYFLGTMLFIGNYSEGSEHSEIQVVDGQQRLTTITILFSVLSDIFIKLNEETLSKQIFRYIMTKDDNGEDIRILKSKSHYPFFSFYIQDRDKKRIQDPSTEEEICIKETYDYFYEKLGDKSVRNFLKKKYGSDIVNNIEYIEILKAIRDQVLQSTFVSISTNDKEQANMIFEILNAKGKRLSYVDLIKNKIFEILTQEEPADFAECKWEEIKNILNNSEESVGFATFFRHYWISKYKKSSANKIYDDFLEMLKTRKINVCEEFLTDIEKNAIEYMKFINPKRDDYGKRKEYFVIVQSLNAITNYFNIVQVRIALLALYELKNKGIIDFKLFKSTILYLENFHFAYSAIKADRPNRLERIYSMFAIALRKCKEKAAAENIIKTKLIDELDKVFPKFDDFLEGFIQLTYSKKGSSNNSKTKYVINKINSYFSGSELFSDIGTVEHILPESTGESSLNIGNLILIENSLNAECGALDYKEKIKIYNKSNLEFVKNFIKTYDTWSEDMIEKRAGNMAVLYYKEILGRNI